MDRMDSSHMPLQPDELLPDFDLLKIPERPDTTESLQDCTGGLQQPVYESQTAELPELLDADSLVSVDLVHNLLTQTQSLLYPGDMAEVSKPESSCDLKKEVKNFEMSSLEEHNLAVTEPFVELNTIAMDQLEFKHDTTHFPELVPTDSLEDFLNLESDYDRKDNIPPTCAIQELEMNFVELSEDKHNSDTSVKEEDQLSDNQGTDHEDPEWSEPKTSTKKRKHRQKFTKEEKRERRKRQNREAAQRSREKKKTHSVSMIDDFHRLISGNDELRSKIKDLQEEKEHLDEILTNHLLICPLSPFSVVPHSADCSLPPETKMSGPVFIKSEDRAIQTSTCQQPTSAECSTKSKNCCESGEDILSNHYYKGAH